MRRGDDAKYVARVLAVGTECDIALLAVDDPAFWEAPSAAEPLQFGPLPRLQDAVAVVGYPVGGDTLSVTSGVVSRIEARKHCGQQIKMVVCCRDASRTLTPHAHPPPHQVTNYTHGMTDLLGVQIDAAINAGNSGGPVLNEEGACVGIAFQSLKDGDTEGIGFVIPTPVIAHFLADYARNGAFTGFPSVGFEWQPLEAPALRASLGMGGAKGGKGGQQKGVLVTRVEPTAPGGDALRRGDVLMAFDGAPISCDGTVPFRAGERIAFGHLVAQRCAPAACLLLAARCCG